MKKWMFLPIILLCLSGCDSIDNPYSVRIYQNIDIQTNEESPTFIEVSNIDISYLINTNSTFLNRVIIAIAQKRLYLHTLKIKAF
jgi:uncharacterized protein YcfL